MQDESNCSQTDYKKYVSSSVKSLVYSKHHKTLTLSYQKINSPLRNSLYNGFSRNIKVDNKVDIKRFIKCNCLA